MLSTGQKKVLIDIVRKTNDIIMEVYQSQKMTFELKSDKSPLTEADKNASNYICSQLKKYDSNIPIICEETEQQPYSERKKYTACRRRYCR